MGNFLAGVFVKECKGIMLRNWFQGFGSDGGQTALVL